jgi:RNA polymerase sigma-32 factor
LPRTTKPQERTKKKPRAAKPGQASRSASDDAAERVESGEEASEAGDEAESTRSDDDQRPETEGEDGPGDGEHYPEVADDGHAPLPHHAKARGPSEASSLERFDPLSAYLREVQRHPLLSPEETQGLAEKFVKTQDSAAAARLVTSNLRLVVKIAYEYRRAYKNIMDLIQEGNIGLMQAVKRYDPYRGVKLSSYAAWWIRAYILRFILNNWRLVKLGTTQAQRKLFFNLRKKRAELQALGIDPTNAEIAKQLNVPESDVAEMDVRLQSSEKSLDAPMGDGEGRATAKVDTMPSLVEGPESLMADNELQGLLKEKLGAFRKTLVGKEKDLAIFDERLVADEPLTLQELGDRFGISRERVRQLEQRLTGRLREYLREEMGDAVEVA